MALISCAASLIVSSRNPFGASVSNDRTCPSALIVITNTTWFVLVSRSFEAAASHIARGPCAVLFTPFDSLLFWPLHKIDTPATTTSTVANFMMELYAKYSRDTVVVETRRFHSEPKQAGSMSEIGILRQLRSPAPEPPA